MLKSNWKISNLGEICDIVNGATPLRTNKEFWENGNFPWFTIEDIREQGRIINYTNQKVTEKALSKLRILPIDTVLLCCTASVGEYAITNIALTTNQQFNGLVIKNKEKVFPKYLMYYCSDLKSQLLNLSGKTTIDFIAISKLKNLEIPIPPLEEQQTIVAKLDQAFAAIDQAKANIEKNITNAKELFQSKLNQIFSQKGDGWEEKTLEKTFKLKSGDGLTSKMMIQDGEYPVYGGNNIAGYYDKFNFEHGVIVGRVGALCGNARFINEKVWITDNAFKLTEFKYEFDFKFLSYLLNFKNLRSYARQAAQPVISNSSLKDVILNFPNSIETQQQIVKQLDQLQEQTNLLVIKYQQKLANLVELKKSILEKAFKGELS